jgi:hypothetical protein
MVGKPFAFSEYELTTDKKHNKRERFFSEIGVLVT